MVHDRRVAAAGFPNVAPILATALCWVFLGCTGGPVDDAPAQLAPQVQAQPSEPEPVGDVTEDDPATVARCWDTSKAPPKTFKDQEIMEKGSHHAHS
jgi:hypothetical protein